MTKIAEAKRLLRFLGYREAGEEGWFAQAPWHNPYGYALNAKTVDVVLIRARKEAAERAAPELLAALKDLVKANEDWNAAVQQVVATPPGWTDGYLDRARAAIAKAEGSES